MANQIICNIEFCDPKTQQVEQIIGRVDIPQLMDQEKAWITVEIKIQEKGSWKDVENLVNKKDIRNIKFYEQHSRLDMEFLETCFC